MDVFLEPYRLSGTVALGDRMIIQQEDPSSDLWVPKAYAARRYS